MACVFSWPETEIGPTPEGADPILKRLFNWNRVVQMGQELVLFLTDLLAIALASERFFDALLLAWLQVKRVTLDLFDNVFGLNFALETAQGIFERFTLLNSNLCQWKYTSQSGQNGSHQNTALAADFHT